MSDREIERTELDSKPLSPHAEAFLDVLRSHVDAPVTASDLVEYFPELEWRGNIATTWSELKQADTDKHLVDIGENKSRVFSYLSNPNDNSLLRKRIVSLAVELEDPDPFLADTAINESLHVSKKTIKRWKKIAAIAAGMTIATGGAIAIAKKRR